MHEHPVNSGQLPGRGMRQLDVAVHGLLEFMAAHLHVKPTPTGPADAAASAHPS